MVSCMTADIVGRHSTVASLCIGILLVYQSLLTVFEILLPVHLSFQEFWLS